MNRRILLCEAVIFVVVLSSAVAARADNDASKAIDLPSDPICEASAAVQMPCLGKKGAMCIWIGDNEQEDHLFEYEVNEKGRLVPSKPWRIPLGKIELSDIEAFAKESDNSVLAIASQGRSGDCDAKENRRQIVRITRDPLDAKVVATGKKWKGDVAECEARIAVAADAGDDAKKLRKEACATIAGVEKQASDFAAQQEEKAAEAKKEGKTFEEQRCDVAPFNILPLNVEGAVSVPDGKGHSRVWLGLRAPLVDGNALLLRLAPLAGGSIAFDGIASIKLDGKGIRELTIKDGFLWGIAGSVADSETIEGRLWNAKVADLKNGATITEVNFVNDHLLPTSEGLVIDGKTAIVIVDGDLDKKSGTCTKPSRQETLKLD